jgi:PBSX family phage terminase large subunit
MTINLDQVTRTLAPIHLRSVVESQARINIWHGSVRSGKTVSSLLRWLIFVAQAPRGRLAIIGKTRETVYRNVIAVLTDADLFGPVARLTKYNNGAPTATILGREVDVLGANDAKAEPKVRGMTAAGFYVDEASEVPEEFWIQLLARLSVPGAKLFATTNPAGHMHWLRQRFILRAGELNLRSWHSTLDDNPHLDPEYVRSLKSEYTGLWYKRYIQGIWCLAEGAIYDMWDPAVHVVDILPEIARWIGLGIDYGHTHPFAALLLGLGVNRRLYLAREFRWDRKLKRRSLSQREHADKVVDWLDGVRPQWTVVDPSAASFVTEMHQRGYSPVLADNAVLDGIRTFGSTLSFDRDERTGLITRPPQLQVHRSCKGLIDEIPSYEWDDEAAEKGKDEPIKAGDDSCDAARYVVRTTEMTWRNQVQLKVAA